MREICRIDRILNMVEKYWKKYPDMRFFQFITFITSVLPEEYQGKDLFYLEDDILEEALKKVVK